MTIALDLGAHAGRSLVCAHSTLVRQRNRTAVAWLADGDLERSWLERLAIPFYPCDGHLALLGDYAEQLARIFPVPFQDLFVDSSLAPTDPVSRQLVALLVEALLPPPFVDGDICCFTHPSLGRQPGQTDQDFGERFEFVTRLIRLRGYDPLPLNPAVALALAEMVSEKFTGLAVCVGASGCDLALTHRGNPAAVVHVPHGGRRIDEEFARRAGLYCYDLFRQRSLDLEAARRRKEELANTMPSDIEHQIVGELYRRLAGDVVQAIEQLIATNPLLVRFSQPLTLVMGGGPVRFAGFDALIREEVSRRLPPGLLGTIRLAEDSEHAVARGCLIHALLIARSRKSNLRRSA